MLVAALNRLAVLNVRELRAHWVRALASMAVIAVSAGLIVAVLGVSGSITGSIDRLAASIGGDADLEVSGITDDGFDESLFDTIAGVDGVDTAVPLTRTSTTVGSSRVLLLGVGANVSALRSDLQTAIQDRVDAGTPVQSAPNGVIAGLGVGVDRGDQFDVNGVRVTAAEVIDGAAAERLNGGRFLVAPIALTQNISDRPRRLDSVLVFVSPGADVGNVRTAIAEAIGGRAVVATPSFRAAQAGSSFAILQAITLLAASVSLVVAAFLSYNAMSIAIAQRRAVISTLRALGGRKRTIVNDLLLESALVGLVGGALGSAFGVLIGRLAVDRLPSTVVQTLEVHLEYVLNPWVIPVAIGACVAASVTASAVAARQVHGVAPVEALAPSAAIRAQPGSWRLRFAAGVLGTALLAATALAVVVGHGRLAIASVALAFIGFAALCFAFSGPLIRAAAAAARWFGNPGVLASAAIERAPQRMWVAMMTVVTAVVSTVAVTGATSNAVDSTVASFSAIADADVWVSSAAATDYSSRLLPPGTEATVRSIPGVENVVPDQMAFATVGEDRVMLLGVAPGSHRDVYTRLAPRDRERLLAGDGVALSRDLGVAMGVSAGDTIAVQTPTGERRVLVLELVPYFAGMTGTIALSLESMQQWYQRPGATDFEITVAPDANAPDVLDALRKALPPEIFVYSGAEALRGVGTALDPVVAVIRAIAWIVALVCAVTLLNTLMMSVLDRRRELGALRAMGATRGFALRVILAEAAGIGVVGGVVGLFLGAAIQYLTSLALTNVLSIDVEWQPNPSMFAIAAGAVVLCLLGSIPPAARAAQMSIVKAVSVD